MARSSCSHPFRQHGKPLITACCPGPREFAALWVPRHKPSIGPVRRWTGDGSDLHTWWEALEVRITRWACGCTSCLLAAGKPAGDGSGLTLVSAMFDVAGGAGMLGSGPGGACTATAGTPDGTALGSVGPIAHGGFMGGTGGSDAFSSASRLSMVAALASGGCKLRNTGCRPRSTERSSVGCGNHSASY